MSRNTTGRIGEDFIKAIDYINDERIRLGIDDKRKSIRVITNKFSKHENFKKIVEDTIMLSKEELTNGK